MQHGDNRCPIDALSGFRRRLGAGVIWLTPLYIRGSVASRSEAASLQVAGAWKGMIHQGCLASSLSRHRTFSTHDLSIGDGHETTL